jgi:hypothetical protein
VPLKTRFIFRSNMTKAFGLREASTIFHFVFPMKILQICYKQMPSVGCKARLPGYTMYACTLQSAEAKGP